MARSYALHSFLLCLAITLASASSHYMTYEHQLIGDRVKLHYPQGEVRGSEFKYLAGRNVVDKGYKLSFGDVISLAGDYYGNWACKDITCTRCNEQISDNYDRNPRQSIAIFLKIARSLSSNTNILRVPLLGSIPVKGYLSCALYLMRKERLDLEDELKLGRDPSQLYGNSKFSAKYNEAWTICTKLAYVKILACNFDHFNLDAVKAYKAGHTAALEKAIVAFKLNDTSYLTEAYFLEGFAQHYLTDMFAAGHVRTSRRVFHDKGGIDSIVSMKLYVPDRVINLQHDEDNAGGLWVRNAMGEEWALYGDKELLVDTSEIQFTHTSKACQIGIDEIYEAFLSGKTPGVGDYGALKHVPLLLDDMNNGVRNFSPLFKYNGSSLIGQRQNLDDRYSFGYKTFHRNALSREENTGWKRMLLEVKTSETSQNLHPFAKTFVLSQKILHVRTGPESTMIANIYGSKNGNGPWTMIAQSVIDGGPELIYNYWSAIHTPTQDTVILCGSTSEKDEYSRRYIGLEILKNNTVQLLWTGSHNTAPHNQKDEKSLIGKFAQKLDTWAIIQYSCNHHGIAKFILRPFEEGLKHQPSVPDYVSESLLEGKLNHMLALEGAPWGNGSTLLALGFNEATQTTFWYLATWRKTLRLNSEAFQYHSRALTLSLPGPEISPQIILTHTILQTATGQSFVLINSFPKDRTYETKIEIWFAENNGYTEIPLYEPGATQTTYSSLEGKFRIYEHKLQYFYNLLREREIVSWSLTAGKEIGSIHLVGYIVDETNTILKTVVLEGVMVHDRVSPDDHDSMSHLSHFDPEPSISELNPSPSITQFFAKPFMKPIATLHNVKAGTSAQKNVSQTGIMSFFDNFGILGVRFAAPVDGSRKYQLKGQIPAIAGQSSQGLNKRACDDSESSTADDIGFVSILED